jgi:hypothetical protein
MNEAYAGLTLVVLAVLGAAAVRLRRAVVGWIAALLFVCLSGFLALALAGALPVPRPLAQVAWGPFLAGVVAGAAAVSVERLGFKRRPVARRQPPHVTWRSLTEHEVSFLRRLWRTGFVLEEDDTLLRERPDLLQATLHDLQELRRLVYVDRIRGSAARLRAYRLTAAGKDLMTWVTKEKR